MTERDLFTEVLQGDAHAVDFCADIFKVSQIWDDMVDGDKKVSNIDINRAFWLCIVEIPSNPFYKRHFNTLQPILQVFMVDWMDSCRLERQNDHSKNIAWVLRDSVSSLVIHCARLIGGFEWMNQISVRVRKAIYDEPLADYKRNLEEGEALGKP